MSYAYYLPLFFEEDILVAEAISLNDTATAELILNEAVSEAISLNDVVSFTIVKFTPQLFGGGGRNARGDIPRKTAKGSINLRGGLAKLRAPKRPRGGIF